MYFTNEYLKIRLTPQNEKQKATVEFMFKQLFWVRNLTVYQIDNGDFKVGKPSYWVAGEYRGLFYGFSEEGREYWSNVERIVLKHFKELWGSYLKELADNSEKKEKVTSEEMPI